MSPPSPNPTSVYRWEHSSALEHACWACPTKSNNPKAIHTCYGIHSMPCLAYHSTMHAIGTSHRCAACVTSREMHESRHREIAELVNEYLAADVISEGFPMRKTVLSERCANIQLPKNHEIREDDNKSHHPPIESEEDIASIETVSTTTDLENSPFSKLTKAERRGQKKALKAQKSMRKAAKNEARYVIPVTMQDVQKIAIILHGNKSDTLLSQTHPLATDKTIEDVIARNLGFVKQIESHKQALYNSIRIGREERRKRERDRNRTSSGVEDSETEVVVDAILYKLGINCAACGPFVENVGATKPSKKIRSQSSPSKAKIVAKLREAIATDLEKHENDLRQTYIRAGGFLRYAGKTVFERMIQVAETIDLQTGEVRIKKETREGAFDVAEELDEVMDAPI